MQVLNVGHNSRLSAVLDAEGVLRCESMMGELLAGVRPLASSSVEPFEDNPKWMWYASISDQGSTSLLQVEVVVEHSPASDQVNSSYSLTRYVRDPQIFLEADGGDE
jgi:general secretion pathway protein I